MKTFELDGANFSDIEGFYDEVGQVLCPGFPFGRNLDALDDVFVGGLSDEGVEYGKPCTVVWKNSQKSSQDLGDELFNAIAGIIKERGHRLSLV